MRHLLDTHTLIWSIEEFELLSAKVLGILKNTNNKIYISSASFWEIAIKINTKKLTFHYNLDDLIDASMSHHFEVLQIERLYLNTLINMPLIHKDPFDRIIVATAIAENLTLLSNDKLIQKYDVNRVW
jgi:PIN domain nuclease of toxin-antitoxin system